MRKLLLWLVMVAAMVAAILGGTAAFIYSRTGADKLPQEAVTFGEQELTANGWEFCSFFIVSQFYVFDTARTS